MEEKIKRFLKGNIKNYKELLKNKNFEDWYNIAFDKYSIFTKDDKDSILKETKCVLQTIQLDDLGKLNNKIKIDKKYDGYVVSMRVPKKTCRNNIDKIIENILEKINQDADMLWASKTHNKSYYIIHILSSKRRKKRKKEMEKAHTRIKSYVGVIKKIIRSKILTEKQAIDIVTLLLEFSISITDQGDDYGYRTYEGLIDIVDKVYHGKTYTV
jgi:hypothetical protein